MDPKAKTSWKDQRISAPAGLVAVLLTSLISAGGMKAADKAWPTEVEVRLARIETKQEEIHRVVILLGNYHMVASKPTKSTQPTPSGGAVGPSTPPTVKP